MAETDVNSEAQMAHCANLVQSWIDYTVKAPDVYLGTQLRAFGVSAGLAMRICSLEEHELDDAIAQLGKLVREIYQNSEDHIQVGAVH